MLAGIADTHAALWYLLQNPALSSRARSFMDDAASGGKGIGLSPISMAEIVYLVEKGRLAASAYDELKAALADPDMSSRKFLLLVKSSKLCAAFLEEMCRICRTGLSRRQDCISVFP